VCSVYRRVSGNQVLRVAPKRIWGQVAKSADAFTRSGLGTGQMANFPNGLEVEVRRLQSQTASLCPIDQRLNTSAKRIWGQATRASTPPAGTGRAPSGPYIFSRTCINASGSVTGNSHVKFRQTYAAGRPRTGAINRTPGTCSASHVWSCPPSARSTILFGR
jgi:hypothetical protein